MSTYIECDMDTGFDFDYEKLASKVINACLEMSGCPYKAEVNLIIVDNEEIHEMNLEQRDIDRATDVLSFPMLEYEKPCDFDTINQKDFDSFNPETGELILGDIVISYEKVISQAKEYGHSPEREFGFLIAHSMLHLFGYDHMDEEERQKMEELQDKILDGIGLYRQ